jgi:hypothetical protein
MADLTSLFGAGALALVGGFLLLIVVFFIAFYVYMALALQTIAKRTKTENGWLAWIPIANVYLMLKIGGLSPLWMLGLLAVFIPFVGSLALGGCAIYWWWMISEARGKPGWWGILMIIPIVNFIIPGILAWGK